MYALIKNGVVAEYPTSINAWRVANPRVSLPVEPTAGQLAEVGIVFVEPTPQPPYNRMTETCVMTTPIKQGDKWVEAWSVSAATEDEIAQQTMNMRAENAARAKQLLLDSDWADLASVRNAANTPHLVNGADFDTYRLALRSIVINPPVEVTWPTRPDAVWA